MGEIKLYIKQHINVQKSTGLQGYYQGTSPSNLTFVAGTLPTARQWSSFPNWRDATDYAGNIYDLQITFTQQYDNLGNLISEGGVSQKRSTTGVINFEGEAFFLIKKWLVEDISASLNVVEVMIEDVGCGKYTNLQINQNDLIYCEDANCAFEVNIKQLDDSLACIQRTLISDNWQGWFPVDGKPQNKQHPRFSYCNEVKPNALLIVMWYFLTVFGFALWLILTLILVPIWIALKIILTIIQGINIFLNILNAVFPSIQPINTQPLEDAVQKIGNAINGGILDGISNMFIESAGCGREHPAPLIRDYISNVCDKCGIAVNPTSAPLFYASSLNIVTSDVNRGTGGLIDIDNPHRNACYLNPVKKRGIRRFLTLNLLNGFGNPNISDYWIEDNKPLHTLDSFLDEICSLYNHEWVIANVNNTGQQVPTLFIYRKDNYKQAGVPVYDFSPKAPDRDKLIQGICYEWNGKVLPALTKGLYFEDSVDTCGNEALVHYNGNPIILHGNVDNNPNFDGELDKRQQLGAAKFRLDGSSNDYILDALQVNLLANFITSIFFLPIYNAVRNSLADYADYALLMKDEICSLPKVIIWDGESHLNAKAIKYKTATINQGNAPQINPYYNNTFKAWEVLHFPDTNVLGNFLAPQNWGAYTVQGTFVSTITRPAYLVNYPMFFDDRFYDNMWDWFHWIDDPLRNVFMNQSFRLKIENCCADLNRLEVFNLGNAGLTKKIQLDNKYQAAKITEVTVSYQADDIDGQYIEIKGLL